MKFLEKRKIVLGLIAGLIIWSIFRGIGFERVYSYEHAYQAASRWIYANIPPGSRILGVHWDDTLPVHLPGYDPRQYNFEGQQNLLPLYELPDHAQKLRGVVEQLEGGDYLIFPTQRLYGSIPRIPKEYPLSTKLFQLLFKGDLGYTLIHSVKVRPQLWFWELQDDTADESLSVYDHPKVVIFRNDQKLPKEELYRRIFFSPELSTPTRVEMMEQDAGSAMPGDGLEPLSGIPSAMAWLVLFFALGIITSPFLALILPFFPDKGFALAKTAGLLLLGYLTWLLPSLGLLPASGRSAWIIFFALALLSHIIVSANFGGWRRFLTNNLKQKLLTEFIFFGIFFLFVLIRAFNPEIFWGEKPMDSTFLRYFVRLEQLPPDDPWFAGEHMNYYYLGTFFCAVVHKLLGTDPAIGFNLSIALIGALIASTAFGIILWCTRAPRYAALAALLLIFVSNFETIRLAFEVYFFSSPDKPLNFDTVFWPSSRVLHSPAFAEYPIWSLLFADLHAHVIALPFTLLYLALLAACIRTEEQVFSPRILAHRLACGLSLGALFALNSWDFVAYVCVTGLLFLFRPVRVQPSEHWMVALGRHLARICLDCALIFISAFIFILPFWLTSAPGEALHWGFVYANEFNSLGQIMLYFGQWLLPLLAALLVLAVAHILRGNEPRARQLALTACAFGAPLALFAYSVWNGVIDQPAYIIAISCNCAALAAFVGAQRHVDPGLRVAGAFSFGLAIILVGAELLFLNDRMNTIFKFYYPIWMLASLAVPACLWHVRQATQFASRGLRICANCGLALVGFMFLVCVAGGFLHVGIMLGLNRTNGLRPTLDGTAYLEQKNRDEAAMIRWLNSNIRGVPIMLEAWSRQSYGDSSRIAMHTGLPNVLGWEHHVKQRGASFEAVQTRREDIETIYKTPDLQLARDLLLKYHVDIIIVSNFEREMYGTAGMAKFDQAPWLFQPLFTSPTAKAYRLSVSNVVHDPSVIDSSS